MLVALFVDKVVHCSGGLAIYLGLIILICKAMRQALLHVKVSKLAAVARTSEWYIQILARLLILNCWT